jgi:ribosomal protein S18 acetylase RimI-like enzyme
MTADAALAEDVEANLFSLLRAGARLPGGVLEEAPWGARQSAFPDNAYFNSVFGAGDDLDLDAQIAWFAARGVPSFFVWTRAEPSALGARLRALGFTPFFQNSPGMAARMRELDWGGTPPVEVHTLRDASRFADFAAVLSASFGAPPEVAAQWIGAARAYGEARPWTMHLAYLDGRPAAISMGFAAGGVLGLYCIGTTPGARGRGLGAAVTLAACAAGREVGCDRAVLFASPEGIPLYTRVGFRVVPIHISRHRWTFT